MILLAGDIGGTKTDLALYSPERGLGAPFAEATLPSARNPGFATLVQELLGPARSSVSAACFGVAGPVKRTGTLAGRQTAMQSGWRRGGPMNLVERAAR